MDKEYIILNEINNNSNISQRELSKKTNLSLGSVNLLVNKMVSDGLIKLKTIPMNRIMYMLTPKGMAEKARKTYSYIRDHYRYINETKEKLKEILIECKTIYPEMAVIFNDDEISQLLKAAINEVKGIKEIDIGSIDKNDRIIVCDVDLCDELKSRGYTAFNIIDRL